MKTVLLLILVATMSTGCSSILTGTSQTITLETNPPEASCKLMRDNIVIGTVESTPGAVMVKKTKHDISVVCSKDGYLDSTEHLESGTEGATFGNILAGGLIGWGIDSATGADNKYPDVKVVTLLESKGQVPSTQDNNVKVAAIMPSAPKVKPEPVAKSNETNKSLDTADRLKTLLDLKSRNLITESEYQERREKLLSDI